MSGYVLMQIVIVIMLSTGWMFSMLIKKTRREAIQNGTDPENYIKFLKVAYVALLVYIFFKLMAKVNEIG